MHAFCYIYATYTSGHALHTQGSVHVSLLHLFYYSNYSTPFLPPTTLSYTCWLMLYFMVFYSGTWTMLFVVTMGYLENGKTCLLEIALLLLIKTRAGAFFLMQVIGLIFVKETDWHYQGNIDYHM